MSREINRERLERAFSDADVVDVDFSEWGKRISLWVLADHWADWHDRKPLLAVRFEQVRNFSFVLPPSGVLLENHDSHPQWHIYESTVEMNDDVMNVVLEGSRCSPKLAIWCVRVEIDEFPIRLLDELNPGWNKSASGLARPGFVAWAAMGKRTGGASG